MKKIIFLIILMNVLISGLIAQAPPPAYYHRYDQIKTVLDSLKNVAPSYVRVDSIGYSQVNHTPLWAIKISENAAVDRDVPRLLFIGDIHSEEIIGQEIIIANIKEIIQRRYIEPYSNWMSQLELWFVPCMNPDGLEVVMSGEDVTYRKNKRDNNLNGLLDFIMGQGNDIDGVDLNRNFGSHWVQGDTLYAPSGYEIYDYYRGPAPFSESETVAIKNLMEKYNFVYSVVWHSSRTGNLAEKVYPPFNFKNCRPAPDLDINNNIGANFASKILKQSGSGYYENAPSLGRNGTSNIWAYLALGNIQLVVECGTNDIQPNQATLNSTITRCTEAVKWLINRATPSGSDTNDRSMLTGKITSAADGSPLVAEVIVHGRDSKQLSPRLSDAEYGRYWRPLLPGNYTITVQKKGYVSQTISNLTVNAGGWKVRNVSLQPLPHYTVSGEIRLNQQALNAKLIISDVTPDTILCVNGQFTANVSQGEHKFTFFTESNFAYEETMNVQSDSYLTFNINTPNTLLNETFTNGLNNFEVNGPWQVAEENSRTFAADSWGGLGKYQAGCDVWLKTTQPLSLPQNNLERISLVIDHRVYTEWEHDFIKIEVSENQSDWTLVYEKDGQYDFWHQDLIDLTSFAGQNLYFRFRLKDGLENDTNLAELTDPGWDISSFRIFSFVPQCLNNDSSQMDKPVITLVGNYPNPFNPETKISFNIEKTEFKNAEIQIFNIKGQKVESLNINPKDVQNKYITWKNDQLSSGVYFYRLVVDAQSYGIKKAILLK